MRPTPAGPVPSTSTARTTPRTTIAPDTVICTQMRTMTMDRFPSRPMVVKPPAISCRRPPRLPASPRRSAPPARIRATSTAEARNITVVTTNIVSTLVVATTRPPIAGPTRNARLSIVLEAPLAAVSSAGWSVREGSQASWAGRKTQPTSGASVARTRTTHVGASRTRATTAAATRAARTSVDTRSTPLREIRSTTELPRGVATAMSASRIPAHRPTSGAPPSR